MRYVAKVWLNCFMKVASSVVPRPPTRYSLARLGGTGCVTARGRGASSRTRAASGRRQGGRCHPSAFLGEPGEHGGGHLFFISTELATLVPAGGDPPPGERRSEEARHDGAFAVLARAARTSRVSDASICVAESDE